MAVPSRVAATAIAPGGAAAAGICAARRRAPKRGAPPLAHVGPHTPHFHLPHFHLPHLRLPWGAAAASGQAGTAEAGGKLAVDFSGVWTKDKARSDPMDEAIQLMALGGLMRQAIKLIRGVEIKQTEETFVFSVLSVISWFKVSESYPLSGEPTKCRRRDFRRGGHVGSVAAVAPDRLKLALRWDDPHGGTGEDVFSMPSPDELVIDQVTRAKDPGSGQEREVRYRSVYTRKK